MKRARARARARATVIARCPSTYPGDEDEPPIVIESRGAQGEPRPSHWQTVLPLLCTRPTPVKAGDLILVRLAIKLSADVETPPRYAIEAIVSGS